MDRFIDLVKSRRSIRRYRPDPVPREAIVACIEAARHAPTASDTQGWRFFVLEGRRKDELVSKALGGIVPNRFAATAPAIVVIAMKLSLVTGRLGARVKKIDYHMIDAGIAGEHIALQAAELGLGTCWIGWFDKKAARAVAGIPATWDVPALLTLGYPDEAPPDKPRRSVDEICSFPNDD